MTYTSGLRFAESFFDSGKLPPENKLRKAVEQERALLDRNSAIPGRYPDKVMLIIAAGLLNDAGLYKDVIYFDYASDYDSYRRQKGDGMPADDLGAQPSLSVSAARLHTMAEGYLESMPQNIQETILPKLEALRQAG